MGLYPVKPDEYREQQKLHAPQIGGFLFFEQTTTPSADTKL
jgi:hypothetical protein